MRIAVAFALSACAGAGDGRGRGASVEVVLAGVDTLTETESLFVGRPRRAIYTPERHLLISDQFARRVVEFDEGGRATRTYGRPGSGPGEFAGPVALALWGSDTVVVSDASTQSISLFQRRSGSFIRRIQSVGVPTSLAATGGRLFLAAYSLDKSAAAAVLGPGDSVPTPLLPFPNEILANPVAMRAYPASFVSARGDSVAVVFIASNHVFLSSAAGGAAQAVPIPNRARRDIPRPLDPVLLAVVNSPERMTFIPSLDGVHWRDDGLLLVWHKDWYAPPGGFQSPGGAVSEATLRMFATLIDRAGQRACVDLAIPSDWAENPAFFADGLSLYGLGHAVNEVTGRATLELRRFDFPLEDCAWTPLPS